jgi:hypothetical protein
LQDQQLVELRVSNWWCQDQQLVSLQDQQLVELQDQQLVALQDQQLVEFYRVNNW